MSDEVEMAVNLRDQRMRTVGETFAFRDGYRAAVKVWKSGESTPEKRLEWLRQCEESDRRREG